MALVTAISDVTRFRVLSCITSLREFTIPKISALSGAEGQEVGEIVRELVSDGRVSAQYVLRHPARYRVEDTPSLNSLTQESSDLGKKIIRRLGF